MAEDSNQVQLHSLYTRERRKAITFMVISVALGVFFVGSLALHFTGGGESDKELVSSVRSASDQAPTTGSGGIRMGPGRGGGAMRSDGSGSMRGQIRMDVLEYINADGSVDTTAVENLLAGIPNPLKQVVQQIDEELANGAITDSQASGLKAAFGLN